MGACVCLTAFFFLDTFLLTQVKSRYESVEGKKVNIVTGKYCFNNKIYFSCFSCVDNIPIFYTNTPPNDPQSSVLCPWRPLFFHFWKSKNIVFHNARKKKKGWHTTWILLHTAVREVGTSGRRTGALMHRQIRTVFIS